MMMLEGKQKRHNYSLPLRVCGGIASPCEPIIEHNVNIDTAAAALVSRKIKPSTRVDRIQQLLLHGLVIAITG